MAWSVPNAFINGFVSGSQWINAARPNNRNGHFTPLSDVSADGWYRNWTWGGWAWCGPDFIASVEPECFVAFSPRQFDLATGLDSKGRHIFTQAALWKTLGGSSIPASTIAAFPAPGPPPDVIPPVPPSPGPGPVAAGVVSIDLATRTVTAPAGWTLRTPHAAAVESKTMADLRNLADSFYAKHGDGSIPPDEKI